MEQILGFYPKGSSAKMCPKNVKKANGAKALKGAAPSPRQTCFQTSGHRIDEIWPDFYVVWTLYPGFCGQGAHFWGQKSKNMRLEKNCQKTSGKEKKNTERFRKNLKLKTLNEIANVFKKNLCFLMKKICVLGEISP